MSRTKNSAVLIIGLCSHGLAMARALHKENVIVYAIEKNMYLPGVKTNSVKHVFRIDSFEDADLINYLLSIRNTLSDWNNIVLMPTNDNHVRFIGQFLEKLKNHFLISWSSCANNILKLQKKEALELASLQSGLNYPRSFLISTNDANLDVVDYFQFPLIIKPSKPLSSFKTEIIESKEELSRSLKLYKDDLPILAQEFIHGPDSSIYFAEMFLVNGKVIQINTGRKLRSYPPERGQATIAELCYDKKVAELAIKFVEPFNLEGPIALELKKDSNNQYWVIEPTVGRTEFLVQVIIAAGINQPYQEYILATGGAVPTYIAKYDTVWFDNEREPLSFFEICWKNKTFKPYRKVATFTYFDKNDLAPFFYSLAGLIKRVIFQKKRTKKNEYFTI